MKVDIYTAERIGTFDKDKNRPLKVKFDFKSMAFSLLAKAKNLKDNEEYGQVFIVPDRRREERIEHRKLVEQLKLIRTQNPEKRCNIWNKAMSYPQRGLLISVYLIFWV